MFTLINSKYGPFKVMLMPVIGMLASAAIGFPLNPSFTPEAEKEYKARADAGDAEAQYLYSSALWVGLGVVKDLPQAFVYAKKCVGQGDGRALGLVGRGYAEGWGIESNAVKAAECYSRFVAWAAKDSEDGDVDAQLSLGVCYYQGQGVERNILMAVKWFRKAAEQGYVIAQYWLALCYDSGTGVETNKAKAVKWYRKAAERGWSFAQVDLGLSYVDGTGVEQDLVEAVKWFRKAAEQEDAAAQALLGASYEHGKGVETNMAEAVKWYRRAAEQGFVGSQIAQDQLGRCYEYGEGVETNKAEAVKWYRKAAEQGDASSQKRIDEIQGDKTRASVCHDVKARRHWLVPVASCRTAKSGRCDSRAFISGMDRGLVEGEVISPSVGKCGYRILSISDNCVWFEAFYDDEPPEDKLPRGPWPDFSRIDTIPPVPPPGRLMLGKRHFWPGDAIKLPNSGWYLMVDDFLEGRGVVFRLLDSSVRPVRELLCVIVREVRPQVSDLRKAEQDRLAKKICRNR